MKNFLTSMLLFVCFNLFSQSKLADLKKEDFLSDFDLTVDIIKKQHPNPFKFISEELFNHKVDSLRKLVEENPNIRSFVSNYPIYLIKDVHLSGSLFDDYYEELFKESLYFPFSTFVERDRLFVNNLNAEIPFCSEIISINGVDVKKILINLNPDADGNVSTRLDRLQNSFTYKYSLTHSRDKKYKIIYLAPKETKQREISVGAVPPSKYYYLATRAVFPYNSLQTNSSIFSELDDENKTGVLTVNTFSLSESYAYKEFSSFFKDVNKRQYSTVIIDVRTNSGGNPAISALLYSFIAKGSFANTYSYKAKNIKLNQPQYIIDENGRIFSDEDVKAHDNYMYQRFDKLDSTDWFIGNSRLMEGQLTDFPKDKDAFSGNVKVLIGSGTISAATYFASLVKANNRGTIIGKETASGYDATTAAWFVTYQLPKTKSKLTVPRSEIYFFNAKTDRGRGLLPDIEIPIDKFIKYLLDFKDPEMSYALEN